MPAKTLVEKLAVLADAAKYDASCASSGSEKRKSGKGTGIGSTEGMGICHAYAPDGRCISLLKILLTNFCVFDCAYCVNRSSSNVERARFSVDEVVQLTLDFYKRNYIEGLFLSSGIIRDTDYTMEQMVEVAAALRTVHDFRGYIHLKAIPGASQDLIERAGLHADRVSVNVELPSDDSVVRLAPEKRPADIRRAMGGLRTRIEANKDLESTRARVRKFAPAGQSTQMIIGADATTDAAILDRSAMLYGSYALKRVYYSAFSPIPDATSVLPLLKPPLMREHRLYQADWLMRFYGFDRREIVEGRTDGMLDLDIDPKLAWALRARERFPVDVNTADRESLLRVPGLGVKSVDRLLSSRRHTRLRLADLGRLVKSLDAVRPFVVAADWHPGTSLDRLDLKARLAPEPRQLSLF
ncbi:putative DNA modification/repair radical SAM protein [Chthonobacter rhizosphaerae]|uniref:putative DNA modification/repair radical SAM protein n=1 Tax=Chthonobacter rhizosphaerae TaxID=2735553 RepID=UPI0015EEECFA|nr:putative DNA modification/repair radical SAM protein [Chthonobacter rhizosphaerae]